MSALEATGVTPQLIRSATNKNPSFDSRSRAVSPSYGYGAPGVGKRPPLEKTGRLVLGRYVWKTGYARGRTVTQWVANGKRPLDLVYKGGYAFSSQHFSRFAHVCSLLPRY
jgi:hypothetical protein